MRKEIYSPVKRVTPGDTIQFLGKSFNWGEQVERSVLEDFKPALNSNCAKCSMCRSKESTVNGPLKFNSLTEYGFNTLRGVKIFVSMFMNKDEVIPVLVIQFNNKIEIG